jgi:predicted LPLAT superfamily acyltransferase
MTAAPAHWATLGETTFVAGIRFLCAIERLLGRWPFRLCLAPVVLCHWVFNATARRASRQYLTRLHAHVAPFPQAPGIGTSLRHFAWFAETLLDKILASHGRYPADKVRIDSQVMVAHMVRGQGGVIVTAHLGCLELCQVLVDTVPGVRVTALVHTAHAEDFNRLLKRLNPASRVELMQVTSLDASLAMRLGERIAAGEFIAIAGDRVPVGGGRTVAAPFLGHPAPFPVGPYVLAAALGCSMFTLACLHEGDGYRMAFQPFAERVLLPRATRTSALRTYATQYATWLEEQVRRSPLDWFNFFPFWDQVTHDTASH